MNEDQLAAVVFSAGDVLRIEARQSYAVDSDRDWLNAYLRGEPQPDIELKRAWLDRIGAAARAGRPWRRIRIVDQAVTDYLRYQAEWSYVDNSRAGEQIRVVDAAGWPEGATCGHRVGDVYLLDGSVIEMHYDADGRFLSAQDTGDPERRRLAATLWASAQEFDQWWADRSDLHRGVTA